MSNNQIISYENAFIIEKAIERIIYDKANLQDEIAVIVNKYLQSHPGVIIDDIKILPAAYGIKCEIELKL